MRRAYLCVLWDGAVYFLLVLCSVQRVLALALRFFTVYSLVKSGLIVTLYGFHGLAGIEMVSRYI